MTRFSRMMLSAFTDAGLPFEAAAEWQWINLDHVERIHEHVHVEPARATSETRARAATSPSSSSRCAVANSSRRPARTRRRTLRSTAWCTSVARSSVPAEVAVDCTPRFRRRVSLGQSVMTC